MNFNNYYPISTVSKSDYFCLLLVSVNNIYPLVFLLSKNLEGVLAGDKTILEEELSLPGASGLEAGESRDDLYRERFELLPPRFDETFQSIN